MRKWEEKSDPGPGDLVDGGQAARKESCSPGGERRWEEETERNTQRNREKEDLGGGEHPEPSGRGGFPAVLADYRVGALIHWTASQRENLA